MAFSSSLSRFPRPLSISIAAKDRQLDGVIQTLIIFSTQLRLKRSKLSIPTPKRRIMQPSTYNQISSPSASKILALTILTSSTGLSSAPVLTNPILFTTPIPLVTRPKIVCFPSSHGVGANVIKN